MDFRIKNTINYKDIFEATHRLTPDMEYDEVNKILRLSTRFYHVNDIPVYTHKYNVFFGRLINRAKFKFKVPYKTGYSVFTIAVEKLSKEMQAAMCNFIESEIGIKRV